MSDSPDPGRWGGMPESVGKGMFSVKMRASRDGDHISGAERIVREASIPKLASAMAARALGHSKGKPDFINIKVEAAPEPLRLKALPVTTCEVQTP